MSQWRARRSTNSNGVKPARRLASPHWTASSLFPNRSRVNDLPIPTPDPTRPDPSAPPYLRGPHGPQRHAVLTPERPVLILARAGRGKTAALPPRLAQTHPTRPPHHTPRPAATP